MNMRTSPVEVAPNIILELDERAAVEDTLDVTAAFSLSDFVDYRLVISCPRSCHLAGSLMGLITFTKKFNGGRTISEGVYYCSTELSLQHVEWTVLNRALAVRELA